MHQLVVSKQTYKHVLVTMGINRYRSIESNIIVYDTCEVNLIMIINFVKVRFACKCSIHACMGITCI